MTGTHRDVLTATADELAGAVFAQLPAEERSTLARCAVVPVFDPRMYDAVLRPEGGPTLERLIGGGALDELPGEEDRLRVSPMLHDHAWSSWFHMADDGRVPAGLREFAEHLERYCAATDLPVERLRALVLVDPDRAAEWCRAAFERYDETFDLAGCQNLLDVVAELAPQLDLGPPLSALAADLRRYLSARRLYSDAFLATDRYLHRSRIESQLGRLVRAAESSHGGGQGIRLHGSGGYGKSTLLRWFIARDCVPARVPCALIDFDRLDPVNATRNPWLVALETAHQLDGQLPGQPFQELLSSYGAYRSILVRQPAHREGATSATLGTPTATVDARELVARVTDVLRDIADGAPLLVVLDTFEEVVLRGPAAGGELVDVLADLLDAAPDLRLVVSGRGSADERALLEPRLRGRLGSLAVPRFSAKESDTYLARVRGIERRELVEAIKARAGGVPWELALDADVVELYPTISAEVLTGLDTGVAWAVDRVLGRVEPAEQWLIRYGSVPRRLSRRVAEEVLFPFLREGMVGWDGDDPRTDPLPPDAVPVFPTAQPVPDFDQLWRGLTRYAATSSWLVRIAGDAVEFDVRLREPMRRLVARQPVWARLHEELVRYHDARAADARASWVSHTRESLYHRFCLDERVDTERWRAAVERAQMADRPDHVAELAAELLAPEYGPHLPASLRAMALAERAWAWTRVARAERLPAGNSMWSQVQEDVSAARRLQAAPEAEARLAAARAALLLVEGAPSEAADMVSRALGVPGWSAADRADLLLLEADVLRATGRPRQAYETLLTAHELAAQLRGSGAQRATAAALADEAVALGRFDEAAAWAAEAAGDEGDPHGALSVRVALDSGLPATALELAGRWSSVLGAAEALTALGRPLTAVRLCDAALESVLEPVQESAVLEQRGLAHAALLDVDPALEDLARAKAHHARVSAPGPVVRSTVHMARTMLRATGRLIEAGHHLDDAEAIALPADSPVRIDARLLRAEVLYRLGQRTEAEDTAGEVLAVVAAGQHRDPRTMVDTALRVACWAPGLQKTAVALLFESLSSIRPSSARLAALCALEDCPPQQWGEALLDLVRRDDPDTPNPVDAGSLMLRLAEVFRVAGRPELAFEAATRGAAALSPASDFAWWQWLGAAQRTGLAPRAGEPAMDPLGGAAPGEQERVLTLDHPLLFAAYRLTLAARHDMRHPSTAAWLDEAEAGLARVGSRVTRWHVLALDLRRRDAERSGHADLSEFYAAAASRARAELGEPTAQAPHHPTPAVDSFAGPRTFALRASHGPNGDVSVTADLAEDVLLPVDHPMASGLRRQDQTSERSPLVRWVAARLRSGSLLDLEGPETTYEGDLRVVTDPALAQLPWELAAVRSKTLPGVVTGCVYRGQDLPPARLASLSTRALQETLLVRGFDPGPIDGLAGRRTERAVRALQESVGLEEDGRAGVETWRALRTRPRTGRAPHVLVVTRDRDAEVASGRGWYADSGAPDLASAYERRGWRVSRLDGDPVSLRKRTPKGPIDVIHLHASMNSTGAVPYLDFGSAQVAWGGEGGQLVTVTDLSDVVRRLASEEATPLVVLDVTASYGWTETVRQLLLRNHFADQLARLDTTFGVLATGLEPPTKAGGARDDLVFAFGAAEHLAGVVRWMHRRGPDGEPSDRLAWSATALFSALPPTLLPARWR